MKLLGLTGGIGMGKSTVANALATVGWPVVDTDLLAREVVEPGQPALAEIRAVFGPTVLAPDGRLWREEMARRVFADDTSRKQLEKILHPRIRQLWKQQAAHWHQAKVAWGVVVIPLLFETDAVAEFERTVCVACTASTQRQRLLARGWTEEDIIRRNAAQWPVEKKMAAADYVIWTEGPLEMMQRQVARVWETLKA